MAHRTDGAETLFDFIVVGSGVSGGRIAYELTEAGARVMLLEAGQEFSAQTFPPQELDYSAMLFWGGGIEISSDGHVGFLRAKCVGGTSIVNQALLDRFDDLAWSDWKTASGVGFFDRSSMESHYSACEKELAVADFQDHHCNRNARIFRQAFDRAGYGWKYLHRAASDCALDKGSDCILCLGGCPRDSKQSSLVTVIRAARKKGMELQSDCEAQRIEVAPNRVRVFATQRGEKREFAAAKLVLAAGAFGNTQLLWNSGYKEKLPALGKRMTCHPQFMTYALFDETVDAHKGAFQTVKSDDPKLRAAGFKLENVYAQPIGTAMLLPGYGSQHQRKMARFRSYASMEVAIRDDAAGELRVAKNGKLIIDKPFTNADQSKAKRGLDLVRELFTGAGAREIIGCQQKFGLHLMGGCAIGVDGASSVVDPEFKLHGTQNVWIADSSVFPGAPGINPSFTIMALSHRAAQGMVKR